MNKSLLLGSILLLISSFAFAQLANDACGSSQALTPNATCGTYNSALWKCSASAPTSSFGTPYDNWFRFTVSGGPKSYKIGVTPTGSSSLNGTNTYVEVFSASCPTLTNFIAGSSISTPLALANLANGTYYFRVLTTTNPTAGSTNALWTFSVCVMQAASNDKCGAETAITPATTCTTTSGSLHLVTSGAPTSTYGTPYDAWYKFDVSGAGLSAKLNVTLPVTSTSLTTSNTYVEVFNSSCPSGTPLAKGNIAAPLLLDALAAGTYYFRVFTTLNPTTGGGDVTTWSYQVCLSTVALNDNPAGAITVATGITTSTYNLNNSTASASIPVGCATGNPDDDVWFKFIPANNYATVHLSSYGSSLTTDGAIIQGFSGTPGSLTSIGCGVNEVNLTGLTAGDVYYFRVYAPATGSAGSQTGFKISITPSVPANVGSGRMREVFKQTVISAPDLLSDPWEVAWGPDGYLWVTEAKGYRVFRIHPVSGVKDTVLNISRNSTFFSSTSDQAFNMQYDIASNPQGGLCGLALHPLFLDANTPMNYVYISYIRSYINTAANSGGAFYRNSIVRLTYNPVTKKLESPETIIDTLPGSSDHNSLRMIIAPVTTGGTNYLFYAAGDMGSGQFSNRLRPQQAQDPAVYEGKILRFNLAPTGTGTGINKWIPEDNPYNNLPSKNAVWVTGIRNNQGFAYDAVNNILYGSSHGPYSDDEINILEKKRNYGHPRVIGFKADENYAGLSAGSVSGSTCPQIVSEVANANAIDAADPTALYKDPLFSAYPATQADNYQNYSVNFNANGPWPSEGWSGIDLYRANLIPGWKNSMIIGSLKWGRVLRMKLSTNGKTVIPTDGGDLVDYFGSVNRYRDIAFSPDGKDMYVVMDKSSSSSGPSANNPIVPGCGGCVQKYTFLGYADVSGKSDIPTAIDVTNVATNTCVPGTTININSDNANLWVPITGPDGNVLAEIKANGQILGDVTSSVYKNSGAIRIAAGKHYLDRNITITPTVQPSGWVDIRLYISKAEMTALVADGTLPSVNYLGVLKNSDGCNAGPVAASSFITVTHRDAHGANGFVIQGRVNSFSSFYFTVDPSTLPLDLLTFTGKLDNNESLLQWKTNNEKGTKTFVVERSVDSRSFTGIGAVAARGNTTEQADYSYVDADAMNQSSATLYYRLKMIDIDGKFTYSNIVTILLSEVAGKLTLAPNPASHDVKATITSTQEGTARWQLVDNAGRSVLSGNINLKVGKNVLPINIVSLKAGVYYLIFKGAGIDQRVKMQKM